MSGGINTHWLMHYRVVALVNQCRRLIRDEFGTRLSLTDPQLRQELNRFAVRSQSEELTRLMDDIAREAGAPDRVSFDPERPTPKRMYRGRPLPEPVAPEPKQDRSASSKSVIYRGRQIPG
jgi:hypothetical protein|tara:strand:+ start:1183 stop:1545 length:363 start_codon:yes stop_codon:yes gene_type:complete